MTILEHVRKAAAHVPGMVRSRYELQVADPRLLTMLEGPVYLAAPRWTAAAGTQAIETGA